mmetsp:Transcript_22726/g.73097  ORF Transcript_22726/g.73097 Transcript_22726/m.73097 type:complete len:140 (-) Transcript_22726:148-567(-)
MAKPLEKKPTKRKRRVAEDVDWQGEGSWSRNSVLSLSLVDVLHGLVASKELTDREAIQILLRYDKSFDQALKHPPALTPDQRRVTATGTIACRTRCENNLFFGLSNFKLLQGQSDPIECDDMCLYLTGPPSAFQLDAPL